MQTKNILLSTLAAFTLMGSVTGIVNAEEQTGAYTGYYGMGPGMMHGWGMEPGAGWGSWHMGRGMMGYGMGPGYMCEHGSMMGPGMMGGYGPWGRLNLNESQQKEMAQIRDELRKKHWELMGKMNDEYAKLNDLYNKEKLDPAAIDKQLQRVYDLQRQITVSSIEAQNRMEALLTPEQKKQEHGNYGHGWMMR